MSVLTAAIYSTLAGDAALVALLATYGGRPAVFTTDPAPGNANMPYIITAGDAVQTAWDTKLTRGRQVWRDVRCYAAASGSVVTVESIAERVRALLHRQAMTITGFSWVWCECAGPIVLDEQDVYGRVLTAKLTIQEV